MKKIDPMAAVTAYFELFGDIENNEARLSVDREAYAFVENMRLVMSRMSEWTTEGAAAAYLELFGELEDENARALRKLEAKIFARKMAGVLIRLKREVDGIQGEEA